uniref:Reverse transcriptase Ty1/copia-type domain-containing protein n=1 Tax=Vitis vinifera TaxID=29760 RepID=A5C587_VITVI|nr:hypothetical protein VITISV_022769 [Vitis vinifera]
MDENDIIVRNKARLIAQGFNQEEGIDYEETFALVARLEAIRMLLAFACFNDFILYQMDVKSALLNGFINEEVHVEQPPGFQSFNFPNHVFKLKKAFYGLKQTPRACRFFRHSCDYSRANYGMSGMITSTIRRVEIHLDPKIICRIFDIAPVGLKSMTRVLLYSRFLTRVFKDVGINLSRETNFEALSTYNTYDDQSMGRMKFENAPNGSWMRKAERAPTQARGQGRAHPGVEEETEIREIEGRGLSTQPSYIEPSCSGLAFTEPTHTEILPPQAFLASDYAPWIDLSAQISSLGTHMKKFVVVSDTRFYSMENRMDQYQCYKQKDLKKIGFRAKNGELVKALANLLNQLEYQSTGYFFPVEVWSRDTKNHGFKNQTSRSVTVPVNWTEKWSDRNWIG